jgi:predicted dienelactone hydrolase
MMKWAFAVCLALLSMSAGARADGIYKAVSGPSRVLEATLEWRDDTRDRVVPVKIYVPETGTGPLPTVIVSHGAGGSREGLAYLGRHWASYGYAVVHLQHAGSDAEIWRGLSQAAAMQAIRRAVADRQAAIDRPQDVHFAVDRYWPNRWILAAGVMPSIHSALRWRVIRSVRSRRSPPPG